MAPGVPQRRDRTGRRGPVHGTSRTPTLGSLTQGPPVGPHPEEIAMKAIRILGSPSRWRSRLLRRRPRQRPRHQTRHRARQVRRRVHPDESDAPTRQGIMIMTRFRIVTAISASFAAVAAAAIPAHAQVFDKQRFHDSYVSDVYDCEGIQAVDTSEVDVHFTAVLHGSIPFPYFREHFSGTV